MVWIWARTGISSPNRCTVLAPSTSRRARVPPAAKPTRITLALLRHRLCLRWWRTRPPVAMPEPAMITTPPSMPLSALLSAVSLVRCRPGSRKGSLPERNSSATSSS